MNKLLRNLLIFLIILFLFLGITNFYCHAIDKQIIEVSRVLKVAQGLPANVFETGEHIKFGVYSSLLRVGSGELAYLGVVDKDGEKLQTIVFKASTFSVNDEDKVFGTLDFAYPVKVERRVRLFGKDEAIEEAYSNDRRSVSIKKKVGSGELQNQLINAKEDLGNVLLLIYNLRNDNELKKDKVYKITLPTQKFDLFVRGMRKIKTPMGLFSAYYLESQPPKYKIWLKSSGDRLPLKIQGLVGGGMMYLLALDTSSQ